MSDNRPLSLSPELYKIYRNTDEASSMWIDAQQSDWLHLRVTLTNTGTFDCWTTSDNLLLVLKKHWECYSYAEPLEPHLGPPPSNDALSEYTAAGVRIDGSFAHLVGFWNDDGIFDYSGETLNLTEDFLTSATAPDKYLEGLENPDSRPRVIIYRTPT
jgi:hypothetical protein